MTPRLLLAASLVPLALAACDQVRGEVPDAAAFSYPTAVVADPAGDFVYVVSTNFDSKWQRGWVTPIDARQAALVPGGVVEVGSFAGDLALEVRDRTVLRGFLALRDDDRVATLDFARDGGGLPRLSCGDAGEGDRRWCAADRTFGLDGLARDPDGDAVDARDPFGLLLGAPVDLPAAGESPAVRQRPLYVGSLLDGTLMAFRVDEGAAPVFQDHAVLDQGLHTLVEVPLSDDRRVVLASVRTRNAIHVVRVAHEDGAWTLLPDEPVVIPQVAATGDYARGLALSPRSPVLYAAFRSPPSVVVLDLDADGRPAVRNVIPLAGDPGMVAVHAPDGGPERVYVTETEGDSVYAVDPARGVVEARIAVGQGPYGIAIAADRAFVANFETQDVSVVSLDPADPARHTEIRRLP